MSRDTHKALAPAGATCDLRVEGIDCASCARTIELAVRKLDGVTDVQVDVMGGRVRVGYGAKGARPPEMAAAIRRAGFAVHDPAAPDSTAPASFWSRRGRLTMAILSGVALLLALGASRIGGVATLRLVLLGVSSVAGGWFVVPRGMQALRARSLDMNFLMTIAAVGAWCIGESAEGTATLFLFAIAELLESYSMDRARNAIRALVELSPTEASVRHGGEEIRVLVSAVKPGDIVIVRPGEKLPVDGIVVHGHSSVNQAPITGESMPVDKGPESEVFAGSLNGQGALDVRSTKPATDTTLARIIHGVEEAQASRAPTQRWVDRFAQAYTPAVVATAILLAVIPPLLGLGTWSTWVYRALAMLVVACPCALVISTPVTIVSGLAGAARAGLLIKGGAHLEALASITAIAIDKTGTLTEGRPRVTQVVPFGGVSEADVLSRALAVEQRSEHPIAKALVAHARAMGLAAAMPREFSALLGRGARGVIADNEEILIGNERLVAEVGGSDTRIDAVARSLESNGQTVLAVLRRTGSGVETLGLVAVADVARTSARDAIDDLQRVGIRSITMLTGGCRHQRCASPAHAGAKGRCRSSTASTWRARCVRGRRR